MASVFKFLFSLWSWLPEPLPTLFRVLLIVIAVMAILAIILKIAGFFIKMRSF